MTDHNGIKFSSKFEMQEIITYNLWVVQKFFEKKNYDLPVIRYETDKELDNFVGEIYFETQNNKRGFILCQKISRQPDGLIRFVSKIINDEDFVLVWVAEKWHDEALKQIHKLNERYGRDVVHPLYIRLEPKTPGRFSLREP